MPPFVGVAVNVSELPEHVGFVPEVNAIETEGATVVLTVTVIPFDVAVDGDAQAAFDVMIQVTIWPLVKLLDVYVALFVPTLEPFTCH